jgi:DNA-binding MarR family transcriptional regulator
MSTTESVRLTDAELHAWRGLLETTRVMRARVEASLQANANLSEADYTVLLALSEAGERAPRSSELADSVGWERSRLSHHLGRMEKRGLLRRDPCATDSRGWELRITDRGSAMFRSAAGPHLRDVKAMFADALTADQVSALVGIVDSLASHLASTTTTEITSRTKTGTAE